MSQEGRNAQTINPVDAREYLVDLGAIKKETKLSEKTLRRLPTVPMYF
jgi:hypothetical protein